MVLGMPHFYIGTQYTFFCPFFCLLLNICNFYILFTAYFFLGIGIGISIIVFACEHLISKYFV